MCVWILGMDCGNRAGKREIRQPISEARLPPSFSALAWHQQSVCSIQFAVCHQFWESGMRWVSQLHRNTEGQCAVCHHFCGVWDEAGEPATNSFSQSLCCTSNLQSCSAETDCGNRAGLPRLRHSTSVLTDEAQLPPSFPDLCQHCMRDVCFICDM